MTRVMKRLAEAEQPHASADLDAGTAGQEAARPPVPEAAGGVRGVSAPGAGMHAASTVDSTVRLPVVCSIRS